MIIGGIYKSPNKNNNNNKLLFEIIYSASQVNKDNILLTGISIALEYTGEILVQQSQIWTL